MQSDMMKCLRLLEGKGIGSSGGPSAHALTDKEKLGCFTTYNAASCASPGGMYMVS